MKETNSLQISLDMKTTLTLAESPKSSPFSNNSELSTMSYLISSSPSLFSDVDLYYEGCQLEDILGQTVRSAVIEPENDEIQKIVENQIDNIEPREVFYEAFSLISASTSPDESIHDVSEGEISTQICPEFKMIRRRTRKVNNPLLKFRDNPFSNMKKGKGGPKKAFRVYPKKEYYRTKLIRSWKRFIRFSLGNKVGRNISRALLDAHQFALDNEEVLSLYAPTKNGPLTEGHGKRHKEEEIGMEKTFNNRYVKIMFQNHIVRESFRLYVINEFFGKNCEQLVERFDFSCCEFNQHDKKCDELWNELKVFSVGEMIN